MSSENTLKFKDPLFAFQDCKDSNEVEKLINQRKKVSERNKKDHIKRITSPDPFEQMKRTWAKKGNSDQKTQLTKKTKKFKNNPELVHPSFRVEYPPPHQLFEMGKLQEWKCAITGIEFSFDKSKPNPKFPSIDRIDSNKGYVLSNMWIVCTAINLSKSKYGLIDFLDSFNYSTPITQQVLSDLAKGIEPTHNDLLKTATIEGL